MNVHEHDVIVIGSGFGGSVAALRLAEKGYDVLVYEAGPRRRDDEFAKTSWDMRNYVWAPKLKCFGVQRIHKLPDAVILAGAGVGGGSLNYANTLYVPPKPFFEDKQWAHITDWSSELLPHYGVAKRMLGVVDRNPCDGVVERVMHDSARLLGVESTFRKTPVGVYFGESGRRVADPYFGGAGPERTGCTECGNCMVGCRVGAKNTLLKNYLPLAEGAGARVEPMRTVVELEALGEHGERGWRVTTERTGAWLHKDRRVTTAAHVVVAAGTWGTQTLLHTMHAEGRLPYLSASLGKLTRTNSEELGGAALVDVPKDADLTRGVAITSSFHVDETTHVENCRHGKGSNAMGLFSTLLIPGDVPSRARAFVREFAKRPLVLLKTVGPRGWSERTVIALVMQSLDNSIDVSPVRTRRGWKLTSVQGHGEPNPSWIPGGHKAINAMVEALQKATGARAVAGGTWGELLDVPMTAHFLGGAPISDDAEHGVIDAYHRVHGYPTMSIVDGAAISANLGVNPSLTITAQAERAFAMWPAKGNDDERPAPGHPYERLDVPIGQVPGQKVDLGIPVVSRTEPMPAP